jgi:ATP-dependent Lon protease
VGGIKEKVLAARRAGLDRVLLPKKNEKDVSDIQDGALEGVEITYVERMDDVIDLVLEDEQLADPAEYFAVPDAEKHRSDSGDGAVGLADPETMS